jgi:putative acetyltransferase
MSDSPSRIRIYRATPADASAVASVLYDSFVEYRPLYTGGGFTATTPSAGTIEQRFNEGPVWVAVIGEEIVGTVAAVPMEKGLYVRSMAVLPLARGQGIGVALLRQVEHYAREQGCSRMFLSTTPFLEGAIRLYEKYGFRRRNTGPQDLFGTPIFSMEMRLTV